MDVLIDDCVDQLISNIHCHRICVDRPWNQDVWDEVYGFNRCDNWNEIYEVVNKIFEEERGVHV